MAGRRDWMDLWWMQIPMTGIRDRWNSFSPNEGDYKANDPDAEVRKVLLRGSGPLIQVDGHQPHPAFELAGVVTCFSQMLFVSK